VTVKFFGTKTDLEEYIRESGYRGTWSPENSDSNKLIFRFNNGAILNWWTNTGSLCLQGPPLAVEDVSIAFMPLIIHEE
jgi:hypothetical protein